MPRLLAHLLLLLYAGVFLHCQPLPARPASTAAAASFAAPQESSRAGLCKKKRQSVQTTPLADYGQVAKAKLPPLDLLPGGGFAALYLGLLFPADAPTTTPARGPGAGAAQVLANHPNKAPPVRFS